MRFSTSRTVRKLRTFSASAAGISASKTSSRAMTRSTRSRELAPRLPGKLDSKLLTCLGVLADVVDGVRYGANLLRVLVGDFDIEGLFKGHHELDRVERIGAQVIHERSARSDFTLVHAQLLDNNLFHFFINGCHVFLVSSLGIAGPGCGPAFNDCRFCLFTTASWSHLAQWIQCSRNQ